MLETRGSIPPRPKDEPAPGHTWVYDPDKGWHEVEIEIRMPDEKPFFDPNKPLTWPDDVTPPRPQNPN